MDSVDNYKLLKKPPFQYKNNIKIQKMVFLFNALEEGWTIHKKNQYYIFKKKHEGKKEVYLDTYIQSFIERNLDI
jgi:hypothetical protein|uniref:Uncharacterized protein n=1 Tax=viral metagenome TaxID=1070528 RepID=A0A6C0C2E7_9ZZZZ